MKRIALLLATAAIAAPLSVAQAADPYVDPAYDWTGFYIGLQAGGVFGDGDVSIPAYPSNFSMDTSGLAGGLYAGYNAQFNNFVFGLEADASLMDVSGDELSGNGGVERYVIDQDWDASVRARAGLAVDNWLLYTTAGVAFSEIETRYDPLAGGVDTTNLTGWTVGAGVEYGVSQNLVTRLQYRYTDYGSEGFFHLGPSTVDYDTHSVMAGLAWKF